MCRPFIYEHITGFFNQTKMSRPPWQAMKQRPPQYQAARLASTRVASCVHIPAGEISSRPIRDVAVDLDSRRAGLEAVHEEAAAPGVAAHVFALTEDGRTFGWDSSTGELTHETRPCIPGQRMACVEIYSSGGESRLFCGTEHGQVVSLIFILRNVWRSSNPVHPQPEMEASSLELISVSSLFFPCTVTLWDQAINGEICVWDVGSGVFGEDGRVALPARSLQ